MSTHHTVLGGPGVSANGEIGPGPSSVGVKGYELADAMSCPVVESISPA